MGLGSGMREAGGRERVCVYVCLYICLCVWVGVYIRVNVHTYVYMFVCMYAYVCMYVCAYICAYICVYGYVYSFAYLSMLYVQVGCCLSPPPSNTSLLDDSRAGNAVSPSPIRNSVRLVFFNDEHETRSAPLNTTIVCLLRRAITSILGSAATPTSIHLTTPKTAAAAVTDHYRHIMAVPLTWQRSAEATDPIVSHQLPREVVTCLENARFVCISLITIIMINGYTPDSRWISSTLQHVPKTSRTSAS
jgi:hypothetical protein